MEVFGDEKDDEFAPYYANEKVCHYNAVDSAIIPY